MAKGAKDMDKKKTNESGLLKFDRGSLYDGHFEVYTSHLDDEDISHAIKELTAQAKMNNAKLGTEPIITADSVRGMTADNMLEMLGILAQELKLRGDAWRVQEKLKGMFPPTAFRTDLNDVEMSLVESGRIIGAIKSYRERTGVGLKDAKDQCDAYRLAWEAAGSPRGGIPRPSSGWQTPY
jgi:ribosomal protein L7/L12